MDKGSPLDDGFDRKSETHMGSIEFAGGVVGTVWGAIFTALTVVKTIRAAKTRHWLKTDGLIILSKIEKGPVAGRPLPIQQYKVQITYEYKVSGSVRNASRVSIDEPSFGTRDWAEARVRRYPVGEEVDVWYSQEDPSQPILETGINEEHIRALGAAVLILLIGLVLFAHSSV